MIGKEGAARVEKERRRIRKDDITSVGSGIAGQADVPQ